MILVQSSKVHLLKFTVLACPQARQEFNCIDNLIDGTEKHPATIKQGYKELSYMVCDSEIQIPGFRA